MIDRLIRNCDVLIFNGDMHEVILNQDITIEKSLIKEIGKTGSIKVSQETKIIDAKTKVDISNVDINIVEDKPKITLIFK